MSGFASENLGQFPVNFLLAFAGFGREIATPDGLLCRKIVRVRQARKKPKPPK
jgi:hypothetical protein